MLKKLDIIRNKKEYILWAASVLFAGISVSYLFNLIAGESIFSQGAFSILLFALLAWILPMPYRRWKQIGDGKHRRRRVIYSGIVSYLLALSFVLGYQLRMQEMTSTGVKGKLFILIVSAGIAVALMPVADLWFGYLDRQQERPGENLFPEKTFQEKLFPKKVSSGKTFLLSWGIIILCWIPVFLAYYPAIMSYDFHRQHQEALKGYIWFNDHHPLLHTALIRWFLLLGESLGSYEVGMALFSVVQMLILSAAMAYSCSMIRRLTGKKWVFITALVLFAVLPIHSVMALSVTKDVLFSAFALFFLVLILELRMCPKGRRKWLLLSALVVDGILMMILRKNAVYAFVIFAIFYVIWSQKQRILILVLCAVILAGSQGVQYGMKTAMQAGSGSSLEMYSVFIQQFCRAALYHRSSLTPDEKWTIHRYVPYDFWEDYNPTISDSIKGSIAHYSFSNWKDDIPGMLRDWVKIGLIYPNEYVDAFLLLTSGYWFLDDVSHAEVLGYGEDSNLGLMYTFNASTSDVLDGIESTSYFPGLLKLYQKLLNGNEYYDLPVLSNLFKPAFYCWALLLIMLSQLYLKRGKKLVLSLFPFMYFLTLLLGPVVQIRYIYPVIIAIPLLLAWLFSPKGWEIESHEEIADTE